MEKLIQRYNVPLNFKADTEDRNDVVKKIRLRVVNVLKKWLEDYPSDFDEELLKRVSNLIQDMRVNGEAALASALQKSVTKNQEMKNKGEFKIIRIFSEKTPEPNVNFHLMT